MSNSLVRQRFIEALKSYIEVMDVCKEDEEASRVLLSGLIYDAIGLLMNDVDIDELENVLMDIESYLLSVEDISEADFNKMFNGK